MNLGPTEARRFAQAFLDAYAPHGDRTVVLFPPALSFSAVREAAAQRPDILLGVQNIAAHDRGAFTGENSAPIARDAGADWVLVGHSERRHVFGESDEATGLKCPLAVANGLTPVLCVGELLEERERGDTDRVVERQLLAGVAKLSPSDVASVVLAYEPVWAIGTGRTATPDDAAAVHRTLRRVLESRGIRAPIPILYGGSVKPDNAAALLAAAGVDGLLVGGASLDVQSWVSIINAV
jgi:triosephosphate isomerase (TIM)